MKAFIQEYGVAVVAVIVVAMLIATAVAISNNGKGKMFGVYNGMNDKTDSEMDKAGLSDKDGVDPTTGKVREPKDLSDTLCYCEHAGCSGVAGCTKTKCIEKGCKCTQ